MSTNILGYRMPFDQRQSLHCLMDITRHAQTTAHEVAMECLFQHVVHHAYRIVDEFTLSQAEGNASTIRFAGSPLKQAFSDCMEKLGDKHFKGYVTQDSGMTLCLHACSNTDHPFLYVRTIRAGWMSEINHLEAQLLEQLVHNMGLEDFSYWDGSDTLPEGLRSEDFEGRHILWQQFIDPRTDLFLEPLLAIPLVNYNRIQTDTWDDQWMAGRTATPPEFGRRWQSRTLDRCPHLNHIVMSAITKAFQGQDEVFNQQAQWVQSIVEPHIPFEVLTGNIEVVESYAMARMLKSHTNHAGKPGTKSLRM